MAMTGPGTLLGDSSNAVGLEDGVAEVTRHILISTQCTLWGKSAGRCEFAGCNRPLWKSSVTQESVNVAQKAHIYSFSVRGSRGNEGIPKDGLNDISNLMLVCHECHQKLDGPHGSIRYTATLLGIMKNEHEERVERVTGIAESKKSQILLYGANIGNHSSPLNHREAAPALFPNRYPASDAPIELSTVNSSFSDRDPEFWRVETENLRRKFETRVRERLAVGEIDHLSVFSLAPQPLLILLGTLLGDIVPSDVYQRHREPPTWKWPTNVAIQEFELREPVNASGTPTLLLASSATVVEERITSLLGRDASVWTLTLPTPHNDAIKSREQLSQLRSLLRSTFDRIKAAYGQATVLHVFPAAAVSVAVEFGRVRMPKADMPWLIYDQVNARGGFIPAISIPEGAIQ